MSVDGSEGGGFGEAGDQGSSSEFCGTGAGSEDITDGDVFDKAGVDAGARDEGFEGVGQ